MTTTSETSHGSDAGATTDVPGPIDYVLIEAPADRANGEAAAALVDLVDRGLVRVLDLVLIIKDEDGIVEGVQVTDPRGAAAGLEYFAGSRSGLLKDEDVREAAEAMERNTIAALIVYENTWAIPFVAAVRGAGGEIIASNRLSAPLVLAALDSAEAGD